MTTAYEDITPMDLCETLRDLIADVNANGYTTRRGEQVYGLNLSSTPFIVDDAAAFLNGSVRSRPAIGVSFISSSPSQDVRANAGQELLTFVILIGVESTSSENKTVRDAQSLLYHLQAAIHGRPTGIGRPWRWAGHSLVPDENNGSWVILQQTWHLIHSFNGYSG